MFWPFKKKIAPPSRVGEETHLIFTLNKSGCISVSMLPRGTADYRDEELVGSQFCSMHRAITTGRVTQLVLNAVRDSWLDPNVKKKIIGVINEDADLSDYLDPLYVFPDA